MLQFREWERALGPSGEEMGSRVAFIISWRGSPSEVRLRLSTLLSASGFPAHLVFGSNPADLFSGGADAADLLPARDIPLSGQFAQRWKLRMMAQAAAPEPVTAGELR